MTKAILIVDMSKSCADCRLRRGLFCGENGNSLYDYIHNDDSLNDKPSWCSLKPLPTHVTNKNTFAVENKYMNYQDGYNACLDEITGETE